MNQCCGKLGSKGFKLYAKFSETITPPAVKQLITRYNSKLTCFGRGLMTLNRITVINCQIDQSIMPEN